MDGSSLACCIAPNQGGRAVGAWSAIRRWLNNDREPPAVSGMSRYHEVYARWQRDPQGFWAEAAREIDWYEPAKTVFDPNMGIYGRWFVGASCNTCWNAVDRHAMKGRGAQAAL